MQKPGAVQRFVVASHDPGPAPQSAAPSAHTVAASSPAAGQQQRRAMVLDDAPHVDAEELRYCRYEQVPPLWRNGADASLSERHREQTMAVPPPATNESLTS
jgi:hypothetical protein